MGVQAFCLQIHNNIASAAQYQAYVKEAAPTILATTVLSIIGYSVILGLT